MLVSKDKKMKKTQFSKIIYLLVDKGRKKRGKGGRKKETKEKREGGRKGGRENDNKVKEMC